MTRMSKTLGTLLKERKYQNCNVKIGSKGGSGFWYCSKASQYHSTPLINMERESLIRQSKNTLALLNRRLKNLDKIYDDIIEKAKARETKDFDKYLLKLLKKKNSEKSSLPKKIASVEYDIATHLLDRPVMEIVEGISPDEKPCFIIYVKGNENGDYWTIKEYEKKNKRRML